MQISCKQCGAEVLADDINLDRLIAKCSACNAVFNFADQIEGTDHHQPLKKLDVPLPKGIKVDNLGHSLQIERQWYGPKYIFLAIFALFWNGFMVVWFSIAFINGLWPMALFGTLHGAVGLGLIYGVVAGVLNTTVIDVGLGDLTIKHGPVPYPGNKHLASTDIKQLYCKEKISRGKNSTSYSYEIHAITQEDKHEKLLTGLDDSEQALYLEQEIERYLSIKDQPVRGEFGR
jgi:hypothetical protein